MSHGSAEIAEAIVIGHGRTALQQGLEPRAKALGLYVAGGKGGDTTARRYHWLGSHVSDFVNEPHAAIASDGDLQMVLNVVASESDEARTASTEFARTEPLILDREIAKVITLALPTRHWVDIQRDINPAHLRKVLLST